MRGYSKGGNSVAFGEYGLKAIERGWITNRQIEAARVAMTRKIKRGGKVWINIFPDKPSPQKPAETRMGSGKGNPEGWVAVVKPGRVMFELAGVPEDLAKDAMRLAGHKLPIRTKFVQARGGRRRVMKASEAHNLKDDELLEQPAPGARGAVQPAPPARHRRAREHRRASARSRRDVARLLTVAKERGIDLEHELKALDGRRREEEREAGRRDRRPKAEEQAPRRRRPRPRRSPPRRRRPAEETPRRRTRPQTSAAEEAPADEDAAAEDASPMAKPRPAAEGTRGADDDEDMDWKARRRLERSRESGEAGPQRSPEERAAGARRAARHAAAQVPQLLPAQAAASKHERGRPAPRRPSPSPSARKTRQGRVVSNKADKTITVRIDVARRHPAYEKIVRRSSTLHAHDERNEAGEGDLVRVVETRPLSRTKRWRLVEILEKAK